MNVASRDNISPLTPQSAAILLALVEKPQYGYFIAQTCREDSRGQIELLSGSLYPSLRRLEGAKMIEAAGEQKSTSSPNKRKLYRITESGRELLRQEMERQADFVALARHRLKHG